MPHRAPSFLWGLFGILAVAALLLVGADVYLAARSGPRWKRRLVGAGIALMVLLGVLSAQDRSPTAAPAGDDGIASGLEDAGGRNGPRDLSVLDRLSRVLDADADGEEDGEEGGDARAEKLAASPEWKRFAETWKEAKEIASGARGSYPFDRAGKDRILGALNAASRDLAALRTAGLLTEAEAVLLGKELPVLTASVGRFRPTEMQDATCYRPAGMANARTANLDYIKQRLELLGTLAGQEKIPPSVLEKVLKGVQANLERLADARVRALLDDAQKAEAEDLCDKVKTILKKLEPPVDLKDRPDWKRFADAWKECVDVLDKKVPLPEPFKKSDRASLVDRLKTAPDRLDALAGEGALTEAEAGILKAEFKILLDRVRNLPCTETAAPPPPMPGPTPVPRASCYAPAPNPNAPPPAPSKSHPVVQAFEFLTNRLPLIERLAAQDGVRPAVLEKVLSRIETNLKTISDPKRFAAFPPDWPPRIAELRDKVSALLETIQKAGARQGR